MSATAVHFSIAWILAAMLPLIKRLNEWIKYKKLEKSRTLTQFPIQLNESHR